MQESALQALVPLAVYRQPREHIFPSQGSLDWYVRIHKSALVEAGALLLVGRTWHAHADRFDQAVIAISSKAAAAALLAG
ncbi:MAG: hypothetical protein JSR59_21900 [Proteobacteria bacterium]|nr:hypothetical protein [Pseudomonadota bacterium]